MTPRERELTAIRHELPDRIPLDAICIETVPEIARYLGIAPEKVPDRLGLDGRIVGAGYTGPMPEGAAPNTTEWGTLNTGDYGTARPAPLANAAGVADVERYPWPDPADCDYAGAGRVAAELGVRYAVRGPYWQPIFCRVADLFGLEEALCRMALQPAVFEVALDRACDHVVELCRRLLDACGDAMPILCLGDDFATQRGLMLSPEQWRRFLKPRYARVFEVGKRAGKFVWFHSCGDITAVLPDLIDIGVDVWETVQLHALPLSPERLKREYGQHLAFFGGVNTQRLPFAEPEDIQTEVCRCIEALGRGGGYICGPDHHIKPDVSAANAVALFEAARAFRREGYTRG